MLSDNEIFSRVSSVLKRDWIRMSDYSYGGTGAPGNILEELLGIDGKNFDVPDAGRWEIKFHSGSTLLTLFHLEAQPKGHMHHMVREFGWRDSKNRISFRHTIHGRSEKGFYVHNDVDRITVRNDGSSDMVWPYWMHDDLINAFISKFRRLIVVKGTRKKGMVRYDTAHIYREPQSRLFIEAVERGIVAIDFDARTNNGRGLRNHGTKFRVAYDDLGRLYHYSKRLE